MPRNVSLLICVVCLLFGSLGQVSATGLNDVPNTATWVTDGLVNAIACTPSTIYLGGTFTRVGPATGGGVTLSAATGQLTGAFPKVTGTIYAYAADGAGGWYIGGAFSQVGDLACNNIAHILASGRVDGAWNPKADGWEGIFYDPFRRENFPAVYALAVSGGTVYAGGDFTSIGGQARHGLAALDAATGQATAWNPNPNKGVRALAVSGGTVYVGGLFTTIYLQNHPLLVALDATSGAVTAWDPHVRMTTTDRVSALAVSGGTVYVGGQFIGMGGQFRINLAALDAASGVATAWNPNSSGTVSTLVVSGGTIYIGGDFFSVNGQARSNLAALDAVSGAVTSWDPNANYAIHTLAVSGGTVYAGGDFTSIGGQARNYLAALDATSGAATAWNPNPNHPATALAVSGGTVYAGGQFTSFGGVTRNNLAAIDAASGAVTAWNPNADDGVAALALSGGTVYAGGWFLNIGGQGRRHLAAIDASSGAATAWNPSSSNSWISNLVVSGGTVYAMGDFNYIGGQVRNGLAAIDASSGAATAWNPPNANDRINALAVSGQAVYVAGLFTGIGGQTRYHLAALDATTGVVTAWNPNRNVDIATDDSTATALAVSGGTVYVGGAFTSIAGQARNHLAALDATTGAVTAWNPNVGGIDPDIPRIDSLLVSGGTVYTRGSFTSVGGQARKGLAALDAVSGAVTAWNPYPVSAYADVCTMAVSGGRLYVGGNFPSIGRQPQASFAQFDTPLLPPSAPSNPGAADVQPDHLNWIWTDASDNETGFKVWADPGTGAPATLRGTASVDTPYWCQTGLKPNTQYTFQVAATNAAGDSARSAAFTTWTLIEPVSALTFPTISTTSIAVAPVNTFTNLTAGLSGIYISNDTAGTASNWQQSATPWVSSALTPNTLYAFRGRSRNGARISGAVAAAAQWTLPLPPSIGNNVACDQTTGTVRYLGATFTFSNPAGFGGSTHGGSPYKVSAYRWAWDTSPGHVFSGGEAQWAAGALALTPASAGNYYLHLQALNGGGAAQPAAAHYGPFPVQAMGRLAASAASLSFTRASGRAVNVELGGQPTAQSLTLTNTGSAAIHFVGGAGTPGLALGGRCAADFQIAQVSPATSGPLAPGGTVTVVIKFAPQETRVTLGLDAMLTVTTDSAVTPTVSIPLLGDAVPVELSGFRAE